MFPVICPFTCFGCCFLCYSFSFVCFLSSFSSFPFFCFASLSLLPLLILFLCLILLFPLLLSWPFLSLLCSLFFLRLFLPLLLFLILLLFVPVFWFLLLSPLGPLSRLSLPFLLLLLFLLFLLRLLPSFLFLFRLRFFPPFFFFPSCWLFFLLVCPRCLFGGLFFFLFAFLAFGLRFFSVFALGFSGASLCSRVGVFGPGVLFSCLYLCLLFLSLVCCFSCPCFWFFCLLLGSSFSCLFCASFCFFFCLFPSSRLCGCVSLSGSGSFFLGFALLPLSLCLPLFGSAGGGGGVALALRLRSLAIVGGLFCSSGVFSEVFCSLFSVPPAVASGSSPLLAPPSSSLSGFAALGWGSAPASLVGWLLPQVSRPSFFHLFFVSDPPLLSSVASPAPLDSAASASAHGPSGIQFTASGSASGLMALSLSLFPCSPYLSLLFVPRPLLHLSLGLEVSF